MKLPWQDQQCLAAAARVSCDVRDEPADRVAQRLHLLTADQLVSLSMTLAALVDLGRPVTAQWEPAGERAPKPAKCPKGIEGHRDFRLERGRWWRCRECERDRAARRYDRVRKNPRVVISDAA